MIASFLLAKIALIGLRPYLWWVRPVAQEHARMAHRASCTMRLRQGAALAEVSIGFSIHTQSPARRLPSEADEARDVLSQMSRAAEVLPALAEPFPAPASKAAPAQSGQTQPLRLDATPFF